MGEQDSDKVQGRAVGAWQFPTVEDRASGIRLWYLLEKEKKQGPQWKDVLFKAKRTFWGEVENIESLLLIK